MTNRQQSRQAHNDLYNITLHRLLFGGNFRIRACMFQPTDSCHNTLDSTTSTAPDRLWVVGEWGDRYINIII